MINYVRWSAQGGRYCGDQARGVRIYCHPRYFEGLPNRLYRNRGDGTFEDVSAQSGIGKHVGKGMSVAFADYDHDGDIDAFVTNDTVPNFLFRNNGDGTFAEAALIAGVAVPESGRPISGMGVDFQDYDNDGWEDIHLTGISGETFPLFRNDSRTRPGTFVETTASSGIGRLSARLSGWCSVFADVDNDGAKDLFTANSHPNDRIERSEATGWQQPNSLFLNDGRGRFRDATVESGFGNAVAVHRGCAVADFDADGRSDIVVLVLGGQPELWHNETTSGNAWLDVRLTGTRSNRDGIGARVSGRRTGADNDDGSGIRVVFTRGCALRVGQRGRTGDGACRVAVGREAGGRGRQAKPGRRDQRAAVIFRLKPEATRSPVGACAKSNWALRGFRL